MTPLWQGSMSCYARGEAQLFNCQIITFWGMGQSEMPLASYCSRRAHLLLACTIRYGVSALDALGRLEEELAADGSTGQEDDSATLQALVHSIQRLANKQIETQASDDSKNMATATTRVSNGPYRC